MNLKELWVGESILIITSGKHGKFEGINNEGKARIRVGDKILLIKADNLDIIPEKEHFPDIHEYLQKDKNIENKNST